ncbi:MAG: Gfo/Idh/MocA family oxidoreductase [Acidobacteria bacterium]|nr:Gfo/Idh/MocA family oxidoreductase [Acidobacteriota bacterium]MCA1650811.1 Gfo/Idh/MocA family oxidoreductase [Acidobacteriota bacterium]
MASNKTEQNGISRRDFTSRVGAAAAGIVVGGDLFSSGVHAAADVSGRVLGANDRVVVASIGIRGQGNSLKRGFARLPNVEVKTLCDIDGNLAPERINDARLKDVATFKPAFVQDLRRVLDDKDVHAVIIATPNHWHALATIWALQAGKHVYVEKPASHTVWEGRKMVEAAARFNKIVQVGTMNRSRPAVRQAIKFLHDGGIGKVYMARGLCYKPRPAIGKYPDGPMAPGEKYALTVGSTNYEPTYDDQYLSKVDYDLWLGPAAKRPFNRNRFHYNWHWHWDYGNGDTGNQGPHQFDVARWGLNKQEHPNRIRSVGGYFGAEASQETPDTQTALFEYADGTIFEFATRGEFTNDEGGQRIGNLFYGSKGWLWVDGDGRKWQSYLGPKNEKGPGADAPETAGSDPLVLTSTEYPHYQNFVDAIRANDPKILTCDVMEGHLSSTLPHLANISYRTGRALVFDGKTETFVDDKKADELLTREYRKGFELPKSFS